MAQFSIRQIMIAIGVIAVFLGVMVGMRTSGNGALFDALLRITVFCLLPAFFVTAVIFVVRVVGRQPLGKRLIIEFITLLVLLGLSAVIWRPGFYTHEAQRCQALARLAAEASSESPEGRAALDRESAWFSRRASALRWRGLWLGLTRGPATRDDLTDTEFIIQMGILETNEKHERVVARCSSTRHSPSP